MNNKKVLLLGSYGQTNLGDDLLMFNYLSFLKSKGFDQIYVNASTINHIPEPVISKFPSLNVLETYNTSIIKWVKTIIGVDVIVYGGGTIYKELYTSTGRSKYSVITRIFLFNLIAFIFRKKIYNFHIGIGSIKTGSGRVITRLGLRLCTSTIFRDKASYDYAADTLRLPLSKIRYSTDGLFINSKWQQKWNNAPLTIDRGKYRKIIAINLLSDIPDWINREYYIETLVNFVKKILSDNNFVLFTPFQHDFNPSNDFVFMKNNIISRLAGYGNYHLIEHIPIDQLNAYFKSVDVLIGMRFHALLLSTINNVPFLAIAYDTKCWRFIKENKYEYALKLEDLSLESLEELFKNMEMHINEIPQLLSSITTYNYEEAQKCLNKIRF